MRRFTYRGSLSLHPVTIFGGQVCIASILGSAGAGVKGAPSQQAVPRFADIETSPLLPCFVHVNSKSSAASAEAHRRLARQADHSSPQAWTAWPGDTSRYWRTGGW